MKTLLYTAYNRKYAQLAGLTVPRMAAYATLHGLDFDLITEGPPHMPDGIYWTKFIKAIEELRSGTERFIWLDVDQMITNFDFEIPETKAGFYVPRDWGTDATEPWHFSVCGFIAHQDSLPLLEEAVAMAPEFAGKPFPEQEPMRQVVRKRIEASPLLRSIVHDPWNWTTTAAGIVVTPRKPFNSVPGQVCPGKVPEPWERGDFLAHLTMLPIEERIKLFHQIKKQL